MNVKKQITRRIYLFFFLCSVASIAIIGKIVYIQMNEGAYWRNIADKMQVRAQSVDASRGSIYGDDDRLLSVSIPSYDLYIDMGVSAIRGENGKVFYENLPALCRGLARYRNDRTSEEYRSILLNAYKKKMRYQKLIGKITYDEYIHIKQLPLINLPSPIGGFILEPKQIRAYPYGTMAKRTIGLYRDNGGLVGIEKSYNNWLKGKSGKRIVRKIGRGVYVPVDGSEIIPRSGKNIITTINVEIEDAVNTALLDQLKKFDAEWGTCIVMEVATGKIKAISNLTKNRPSNDYIEDFNYAVTDIEPGSTMKLVALMKLLEDGHIDLNDSIDISNGSWNYYGITIKDSEHESQKQRRISVQNAFAFSSNVGISKLVYAYYRSQPKKFTDFYSQIRADELVSLGIPGEQSPFIKNPSMSSWSSTSLLWMSFGYEIKISPIGILALYNAIANGGKMTQPYLVAGISADDQLVEENKPTLRVNSICSDATLKKVKKALESVVEYGTGRNLKTWYGIAGKTGTSLVYDSKRRYNVNHYLSSFAGYFPKDKPKYSCIVFIQNKPDAPVYYGAYVAAPVFKNIADYIMASRSAIPIDSLLKKKNVYQNEFAQNNESISKENYDAKTMPDMSGWQLSDAIFFCENNRIAIRSIKGKGRIAHQSLASGASIENNAHSLELELQ